MIGRARDATPLVGRRRELDAIKRLIEGSRLVTLVGVGGTGKTRLASRTTEDLARAFHDGVFLVELAPVEDAVLLGHTIATALGMQVGSVDWSNALLADFISEKRILLTLDNCEHLVDACSALIDDLLHSCPGIRILATSQQNLGLTSEVVYPVPPLTLPPATAPLDPKGLLQYEAIALFVARAAALQAGFELTETNAAAVVELCRALDGIPLAIELAAARIRVLAPAAMVERLPDRYRLLSKGYGGRVPDRQRSLEASVQWTWDLCGASEQRLWARLSVFRGGFTLEAAEEICGDATEVFEDLAALVDRSVLRSEDVGSGVRFLLLETLRLYGERQLDALEEAAAIRLRHRDHFLSVVTACDQDWTGPNQIEWMSRLRQDHANLRAALQWSIDRGDAVQVLRLAGGIEGYWIASGTVSEARRWLRLGLAMEDQGDAPEELAVRIRALRLATWFALMQVDFVVAEQYVDQAEWLARSVSADEAIRCELDMARGILIAWQGDPERATPMMERSIEVHGRLGHATEQTFGLVLLGMLLGFVDQTDRARAAQGAALEITESRGEIYMRSFALALLGLLDLDQNDLDGAARLLDASLRMKRSIDDRLGIALVLEFFSWHAVAAGHPDRAATLRGAADRVWQQIGVTMDVLPFLSLRRAEGQAKLRASLKPEQIDAAVRTGERMDAAAAVRYALHEDPASTAAPDGGVQESPLTRREAEVADLVAEGLTNQQIADRLVISPRTAEAHVDHILRKLGFSSRAAIASWLAEQRHG